MLLTPGQNVDGFVVASLCDDGGTGQVYRVRRPRSRQERALKVVPVESPEHRLTLLDGVLLVAELRHRCLIPIEDVLELPDALGLLTEFVDGPSLAEVLAGGEPLGAEDGATLGEQLAALVGAAHAAGVANLGLSPRKVLLAEAPEGIGVRVVGLDLARLKSADPSGIQADLQALRGLLQALGGEDSPVPEAAIPAVAAESATVAPSTSSSTAPAEAPADPTPGVAAPFAAPKTAAPPASSTLVRPWRLLGVVATIFSTATLWQAAERADEVHLAEAHFVALANTLDGPFRTVPAPLGGVIARAEGGLIAPAAAFASARDARARVQRGRDLIRAIRAELARQRAAELASGGELALAMGQIEPMDDAVREAEVALETAEALRGQWADRVASTIGWLDADHAVGDLPVASTGSLASFQ